MPVGLLTSGLRPCDALARQELPGAASRVFTTPPRAVLELGPDAPNADVQALSRALTGQGVSRQALHLAPRILALDAALASREPRLVVEVHPELSFAELSGGVLDRKTFGWRRAAAARGTGHLAHGRRGRARCAAPRECPSSTRSTRSPPCGQRCGGETGSRGPCPPTPPRLRSSPCSAQAGVAPGSRCRFAATTAYPRSTTGASHGWARTRPTVRHGWRHRCSARAIAAPPEETPPASTS